MSKIEDLINKLCPNGVEYQELKNKNLFKFYYGKGNKIPEDIGGIYDVYGANGVVSHINEYNCEDVTIIGHIGAVGMVNRCKGKCFVTYNGTIAEVVDKTKVNSQYLYYVLTTLNLPSYKKGSQPFLSVSDFERIRIAVPPLEVQDEIVHILDDFTLLSAELSAELKARQQQYDYYKTKLFELSNDAEYLPLEKIAEIGTGSSNTNEAVDDGKYPFFVRSQQLYRKNTFEYDETAIITSGDGVGVGKIFHYIEGKYALHQRAYRIHITNEKVIPKYFFYYMKTTFYDYIMKNAFNSSVTSVRRPMLNKYPVPIPSKEEQERIVNILDRFDKLCNDITDGLPAEIEARQKQYEYYRDKLLTFKELKVSEVQ